jgi:hypothetical protein
MLSLEKARSEIVNFADKELYNDISDDPIGLTTLLFFLLNNRLESPAVDCMIAQTDAWVDEKLNQQSFTRFLDRELVSAVFGLYVLMNFKRLRVKVETETLERLLSQNMEDRHFFHNYTYSAIIALSIIDQKISISQELKDWINQRFENEVVFNDAKKLVFTAMLFHKTNQKKELLKLVENCHHKLLEGTIPYYDRIYYAWVAWEYRELLPKEAIAQMTQSVSACLENFFGELREKELNRDAKEIYGKNVQGHGASRIALGVYIDLSTDFTRDTVLVSKEELARTPILTRIGSLAGSAILAVDVLLLYLAMIYGLVGRISIELLTQKPFTFVTVLIVDIIIMSAVVFMAAASLSLVWDTAVKGYANNHLILNNLRTRVKQWIKEIIIGNIILGILIGIILGI